MHSHSTFKVHQVELETLILKESHLLFFPHYPTILSCSCSTPHSFDNWLCPVLDVLSAAWAQVYSCMAATQHEQNFYSRSIDEK